MATHHPSVRASILQTIGNTPVVSLNKIPPPDSAQVVVKLEYFSPTGSYKDRMALAMIEEAEARGDLHPGMTVVEYRSSQRYRSPRQCLLDRPVPKRGFDQGLRDDRAGAVETGRRSDSRLLRWRGDGRYADGSGQGLSQGRQGNTNCRSRTGHIRGDLDGDLGIAPDRGHRDWVPPPSSR
jgi:Pyridoxal-phosphate dependent enzyme